ncbi:unnamed protein product [Prunus armeniaca]
MECEGQVTPEVRSELKLKLGLEFDCCDDVFNFYNMYAAKAGFGIRCSTTRTCTLIGEVTRKEYVCCKQGYSLTSIVSRKRRRLGCTRTSCKAKLAILKVKDKNKVYKGLKRWLQSAKSGVIYDKNHKEINDCVDGLLLVKRSKVCKVASDLIDSALLCNESFELLEKSFDDIRGKLIRLVLSRAHVEEPNGDVGTSYPQLRIKDPHRVKVKGRAKRVKGEEEKAVQRHKRRCTECRKTDDDRRSCPKFASL